jgi:hypothetical protein
MKKTPGQIAYEGYCKYSGGRSLVSGVEIPPWETQSTPIQAAWESAAQSVLDSQMTPQIPPKEKENV